MDFCVRETTRPNNFCLVEIDNGKWKAIEFYMFFAWQVSKNHLANAYSYWVTFAGLGLRVPLCWWLCWDWLGRSGYSILISTLSPWPTSSPSSTLCRECLSSYLSVCWMKRFVKLSFSQPFSCKLSCLKSQLQVAEKDSHLFNLIPNVCKSGCFKHSFCFQYQ